MKPLVSGLWKYFPMASCARAVLMKTGSRKIWNGNDMGFNGFKIMRKFDSYLFALSVLLLMVSCNVNETVDSAESSEQYSFTAEFDGTASKSVLYDGTKTYWEPGDAIAVYDGILSEGKDGVEYETDIKEPSPTADFYGTEPALDGNKVLALYPAGAAADAVADMENLTLDMVYLPSSQEAIPGSYDPASALAVAYSEDESLLFRNVNTLLKFTVADKGVSRVIISACGGESLTGFGSISYNDGDLVAAGESAEPSDCCVVVDAGDGTFETGREYYASVYPRNLEEGFTVEFVFGGSSDRVPVKSYPKSLVLKRNVILNIGSLESRKDEGSEWDNLQDPAVTILENRIAAAYFEAEAVIPKNCSSLHYGFYSEADMLSFENGSSVNRKKEAIRLVNEGWGETNGNFSWDKTLPEGERATGSYAEVLLKCWGDPMFVPGATIYIGYTARDGGGAAKELKFAGPVKLDSRNLAFPDNCNVKDLEFMLSDPSRTSFKQIVTYDPSTVSMVYSQYISAENTSGLTENTSWEDWVNYIFKVKSEDYFCNEKVNAWCTVESGYDPWTFTGMTPGKEYTVFLCAEDFDGNVSPIYFETISTKEIQIGPDPTVNMELRRLDDCWSVVYTVDHDVESFKYAMAANMSYLNVPGATGSSYADIAGSGIEYEVWRDALYKWISEVGMDTHYESVSQEFNDDGMRVAVCLAQGKDASGNNVYKMNHLIIKDGKTQTLEEIFSFYLEPK